MQHLVLILDESASSFCVYPNPQRSSELMSYEILKKAISFAQRRNLSLNILAGKTELPQSYLDSIDLISHLYVQDAQLPALTRDDILIVDITDKNDLPPVQGVENIIVRVSPNKISKLSKAVLHYVNDVKRINIHLTDVDLFGKQDFDLYQKELNKLSDIYKKTLNKELNILTDRTVLFDMNNCDAGIQHITLAPNGKLYICPAFYYDNPENTIGHLDDELQIVNKHLFQLDYAPICRQCDAFHCKRCLWLNQKTTGEINTPSHEQCVVSHLERNTSRAMLSYNQVNTNCIPEINYLDPFEK